MQDILRKAAQIRLVVFDVDGVFTDGSLYFGNDGNEYKAFNIRDGHGIKMLHNHGLNIAIISGRSGTATERRMAELGIQHIYLNIRDKLTTLERLLDELRIETEQVAYVGDDIVDLPVMRRVGLAIAVADADPFVLRHAHWRTERPGGHGAVRDVCELILQAQGRLDQERSKYL